MRIERTGPAARLTPRMCRFLVEHLGGISLDELESDVRTRIDYACLNGLLAVEVKTLEEDGSERMDNLTEALRARDDWPLFMGSAPMESFIKNMGDPEGVRRQVLDRVGRAIINHLKKANRQLGAHAAAYPRKNQVRLLVLLNEDHEIYDPETVAYILFHALRRREGGELLYPNVDAVLYFSERHATVIGDRLSYPTVAIEGQPIGTDLWKRSIVSRVIAGWADWNGNPLIAADTPPSFSTIDVIPEHAPRHERWRTDYRRRPYLRPLSRKALLERFNEVTLISMLAFLKSSPIRIPPEAVMQNMEHFTHLMVELGERAIPMTELPSTLEGDLAAARRIGLPSEVMAWLPTVRHNP